MGNTKSCAAQPLAIMAVARELKCQRSNIVVLRDTLGTFADAEGMVEKEWLDQALKRANISDPTDVEIFKLLFTMWDSDGHEKIPYKNFSVGVSPLACPHDDLASVLRFALYIGYDNNNEATVNAEELHDLILSISSTASYFGDASLPAKDIDTVVEAVFDKLGQNFVMPHPVCVRRLQANAYIRRFLSGKRRSRVKFKEDLTLVTEFTEKLDQLDKLAQKNECTSPIAIVNSIVKANVWTSGNDACNFPSKASGMTSLFSDNSGSWDSLGGSILSAGSSLLSLSPKKSKPQITRGADPPVFEV